MRMATINAVAAIFINNNLLRKHALQIIRYTYIMDVLTIYLFQFKYLKYNLL